MRRSLALLATICLALAAQSSAGEKKDKQAEGLALIERARELSDIRAPGSPPFRLQGRIRILGPTGDPIEGRYFLLWISREQFREDIVLSDYRQISVIADNKVWRARPTAYKPLRIYQVEQVLLYRSRLELEPNDTIKAIRSRTQKGRRQKCVKVGRNQWTKSELCFDEATGAIARQEYELTTYEYGDYLEWGNKIIPRSARFLEDGKQVVEIQVEEVSPADTFDPGLFTPPPGVEAKPGCQDPEPGKPTERVDPIYPQRAKELRISGTVSIYAVVGIDGGLRNLAVIRTAGPELDNSTLEAVSAWRFHPATCGGQAVETETVIDVSYRLY